MTHTERLQLAIMVEPGMEKSGFRLLGMPLRAGAKALGSWLTRKGGQTALKSPAVGGWLGRKGNELVTAGTSKDNILGSLNRALWSPTGNKPADFIFGQVVNPFSTSSLMGFNPINRFGPSGIGKYFDGTLGFNQSGAEAQTASEIAQRYAQLPWYQRVGMSFNPESFTNTFPEIPHE